MRPKTQVIFPQVDGWPAWDQLASNWRLWQTKLLYLLINYPNINRKSRWKSGFSQRPLIGEFIYLKLLSYILYNYYLDLKNATGKLKPALALLGHALPSAGLEPGAAIWPL
jgi:hypothetical protein